MPANPITPEALEQMEAVAKAATLGPWVKTRDQQIRTPGTMVGRFHGDLIASIGVQCPERAANGAHIATFDPPTVLSLIASARRAAELEAKRDALKAEVEALRGAVEKAEAVCDQLQFGLHSPWVRPIQADDARDNLPGYLAEPLTALDDALSQLRAAREGKS